MGYGGDRGDVSAGALAGLAVFAAAAVLVLAAPFVTPGPTGTSYAAVSRLAAALDVAVGGLLACAALAVLGLRPAGVQAALVAGLAVAWLADDLVAWTDGPPLIRSLAMVAVPLVLPLAVQLAVRSDDQAPQPVATWLAAGVWLAVLAVDLGVAAVRDPFLDLDCWDNCRHNVLLVTARPGAAALLVRVGRAVAVTAGLALAAWCCWRLAASTAAARRQLACLLGPAMLVGGAEAAHGAALLLEPREDPQLARFLVIHVLRAGALMALAAGVAWFAWRTIRVNRALGRLTAALDLVAAPGAFEGTLQRLLGDNSLSVAYWSGRLGRFVDPAGATVADPRTGLAASGRTTAVMRGGEVVAVIRHPGTTPGSGAALQRRLGAAARLAVDNERLRAELSAQTAELRASRARIVAAGDAGRCRVERDLHDGVQQSLLAILFEVRLALAEARRAERPDLVDRLDAVSAEVQVAIDDLRGLARGIYPAILNDAGLAAAVRALTENAPLPLDVTCDLPPGCGPEVELAVYRSVVDLVGMAERSRSTGADVRIVRSGGEVVVSMAYDGEAASDADLLPTRDRVGAVGGHVLADRAQITVVVPCGS